MQGLHCVWSTFNELSGEDIYELLRLRQQVFIVEQRCAYLDADGLDRIASHLLAHCPDSDGTPRLVGYLRLLPPGARHSEPAIGRLVTTPALRSRGLARHLMHKAIDRAATCYPSATLHISAQLYLADFYRSLGFFAVSDVYEEDGIPHLAMHLPLDPRPREHR